MQNSLDTVQSADYKTLVSPLALRTRLPVSSTISRHIQQSRTAIAKIIEGSDPRLLVVVGPCSIHDVNAAIDFAALLEQAAARFADELLLVMRVYFEKPRTVLGWGGFINDPGLDGTYDINRGLTAARQLLLDVAQLGLPAATEFLDIHVPAYLGDLICWSAIGARTVESQVHRQLASGLQMPVGFKNTTDGNIKIAIDAVQSARHAHHTITLSPAGNPAIFKTSGNQQGHVILRGAVHGANYMAEFVNKTALWLSQEGLTPRMLIDCSHGNSRKNYHDQAQVISDVIKQLAAGSQSIAGIMLESNLVAGSQTLQTGKELIYGQSITDPCLSFAATLPLLEDLAVAIKQKQ